MQIAVHVPRITGGASERGVAPTRKIRTHDRPVTVDLTALDGALVARGLNGQFAHSVGVRETDAMDSIYPAQAASRTRGMMKGACIIAPVRPDGKPVPYPLNCTERVFAIRFIGTLQMRWRSSNAVTRNRTKISRRRGILIHPALVTTPYSLCTGTYAPSRRRGDGFTIARAHYVAHVAIRYLTMTQVESAPTMLGTCSTPIGSSLELAAPRETPHGRPDDDVHRVRTEFPLPTRTPHLSACIGRSICHLRNHD
jgi:hypothetical protein